MNRKKEELKLFLCNELKKKKISFHKDESWLEKKVEEAVGDSEIKKKFAIEEMVHYLKVGENALGKAFRKDYDVVCDLYKQQTLTKKKNSIGIQDPEVTLGNVCSKLVNLCRKCKSKNTLTMAIQTRSADEPTSYYSQCYSCNHKWRSD